MSKLIDEYPLVVLPSLAIDYGLNEAIVIQQIHYWTSRKDPMPDGHSWVYNSVREWKKQFPFWSERTIFSILKKLRESEILIAEQKSENLWDQTLYYRLNYEKLRHSITQTLPNGLGKPFKVSKDTESNAEIVNRFEVFWKKYPRKVARPQAEKIWKKIKPNDELLNKMLVAIDQQELHKREKDFVPHPSTWLNNNRWEDEIPKPSSAMPDWTRDARLK